MKINVQTNMSRKFSVLKKITIFKINRNLDYCYLELHKFIAHTTTTYERTTNSKKNVLSYFLIII